MASPVAKQDWQRAIVTMSACVTVFLAIFVFYEARTIFIPFALAIFFSFVLSPVVNLLQQRVRLGRVPAVMLTVAAAIGIAGLMGYIVTRQLASLTETLPQHTDDIVKKIETVRGRFAGSGDNPLAKMFDKLQKAVVGLPESSPSDGIIPTKEEIAKKEDEIARKKEEAKRIEVVSEPRGPSWSTRIQTYATPAVEILGQMAFSFVLVVFMLLKREDLRNRMIRLLGDGKVTTVTKAIDDASRRVSSYLLMQALLNASFGTLIAVILLCMGVQYAVLWGFIAAVMRYIPYIGTLFGVIPPTVFSLAISDNFTQPVSILALYFTLEAINNNFLEPRLYGKRLGVSEVALLVAAAFWSFLWGPVGLILSSPLTTCLLVLGKHVPQAKFIEVLLGDEPALEPKVAFYQRLSARDQDEATEIVMAEVKCKPPGQIFDEVVVPALGYVRRDTDRGEYSEADMKSMVKLGREVIEEIVAAADKKEAGEKEKLAKADPDALVEAATAEETAAQLPPVPILICPARDMLDALAGEMLGRLLDHRKWAVEIAPDAMLTSELTESIEAKHQTIVCILAIPPGGISHTRYLCKRIRQRFPDIKILISLWGMHEEVQAKDQFLDAGADHVETSLQNMLKQLDAWRTPLAVQAEPTAT